MAAGSHQRGFQDCDRMSPLDCRADAGCVISTQEGRSWTVSRPGPQGSGHSKLWQLLTYHNEQPEAKASEQPSLRTHPSRSRHISNVKRQLRRSGA